MYLVDVSNGTFTNLELARLAAYRAAVAAGFYSDWDGTTQSLDCELLRSVRDAEPSDGGSDYPFTPQERERLEQCRDAVAEGRYMDDLPPAAVSGS